MMQHDKAVNAMLSYDIAVGVEMRGLRTFWPVSFDFENTQYSGILSALLFLQYRSYIFPPICQLSSAQLSRNGPVQIK